MQNHVTVTLMDEQWGVPTSAHNFFRIHRWIVGELHFLQHHNLLSNLLGYQVKKVQSFHNQGILETVVWSLGTLLSVSEYRSWSTIRHSTLDTVPSNIFGAYQHSSTKNHHQIPWVSHQSKSNWQFLDLKASPNPLANHTCWEEEKECDKT